jgi:hypothetical protein
VSYKIEKTLRGSDLDNLSFKEFLDYHEISLRTNFEIYEDRLGIKHKERFIDIIHKNKDILLRIKTGSWENINE